MGIIKRRRKAVLNKIEWRNRGGTKKMTLRQLDNGKVISRIKQIPDVISIKLNDEWKRIIAEIQEGLEQPKTSTVIKQALVITHSKVLSDPSTAKLLEVIFENKRKNKRLGYDLEYE